MLILTTHLQIDGNPSYAFERERETIISNNSDVSAECN